jgi:hypothetical protein
MHKKRKRGEVADDYAAITNKLIEHLVAKDPYFYERVLASVLAADAGALIDYEPCITPQEVATRRRKERTG